MDRRHPSVDETAAGGRAARARPWWWATALAALAAVAALTLPEAAPQARADDDPVGTAFGRPCAAVVLLAIPGSRETSESAGRDDAKAMLGNVTRAITSHADASVTTHYLGYPATLKNYGDSRRHGYEAAWSTVRYYARQCPAAQFILLGYSQGAHIAGDLATTIGTEGSPVSPDRIRSVRLLADPARNPAHGRLVGMSDGGTGGMFPYRGGFGSLEERVTEYCAAADPVCHLDDSTVAGLTVAPHKAYATATVPGTDQTFTDRVSSDLVGDITNLGDATF